MSNSYFDFKQFRVAQDQCAMKVSTDACIQGAWLAQCFAETEPASVLDIGTGTGLLSLMLAQALPQSQISAIEINEQAFEQALLNVRQSPWPEQITVYHSALQEFEQDRVFEAIICNPPFFHNHLESEAEARRTARHSNSLSKEVLAAEAVRRLAPGGWLGVLYPVSEWKDWMKAAAEQGFYAHRQLWIQPHGLKPANRVVGLFCQQAIAETKEEVLCIYESGTRNYTSEMIQLLKDYYLQL